MYAQTVKLASGRTAAVIICALACGVTAGTADCDAGSIQLPLALTDTRPVDGAITVEGGDWKLVFSESFNGGPHQWFDLAADPGETDNLAAASGGGTYTQGVLFDYDVYLGTTGGNAIEFMTTMGFNSDPGAVDLSVLEDTPARVRIRQQGHPRLNNGQGPPGNPFPELELFTTTTIWTIYPTGKVHIDFTADVEPAGMIVDTGPGGAGKGIDASGCCGTANIVEAVGGANFLAAGVWAGDTIETVSGGWGPYTILTRLSPTKLKLTGPVPAGQGLDYTVRRTNIVMETISIHGDGDSTIVNQCSDPAVSLWQGGSNGDSLWAAPDGSPCKSKMRNQGPLFPPLADDVILAHWTRDRAAGSLLAFFEPWTPTFGAFNDQGFTDISYTQLGKLGIRPAAPHHRHFLAQMGSSASSILPRVRSVVDALPIGRDFRTPYAEALAGMLESGPEIAAYGFDPGMGTYGIAATLHCTYAPGRACSEAAIRFDASGGDRSDLAYRTPVVRLSKFSVIDGTEAVYMSANGGTSFTLLGPNLYNLTSAADEAALGDGVHLFQYLSDISPTASGPAAVAFRITGLVAFDKKQRECRNRIRRRRDAYFAAKLRAMQRCTDKVNAGSIIGPCPDAETAAKIMHVLSRLAPEKLEKTCPPEVVVTLAFGGTCTAAANANDLSACAAAGVDVAVDAALGAEYSQPGAPLPALDERKCQIAIAKASGQQYGVRRLRTLSGCTRRRDRGRVVSCPDSIASDRVAAAGGRVEERIAHRCTDALVQSLNAGGGFGGSCAAASTVAELATCEIAEHGNATDGLLDVVP